MILQKPPQGFYTRWNLSQLSQKRCTLYELLECNRLELARRMYVAYDGVSGYDKYLLHKGNLYEIRWMNDAKAVFLDSRLEEVFTGTHWTLEMPRFIASIRRCKTTEGELRIALVQHKRRNI